MYIVDRTKSPNRILRYTALLSYCVITYLGYVFLFDYIPVLMKYQSKKGEKTVWPIVILIGGLFLLILDYYILTTLMLSKGDGDPGYVNDQV